MTIIKELLLKEKNKKILILVLALIGAALIILSYFPLTQEERGSTQSTYIQSLEAKTKETIEKITGKDTTEVMITLKNNYVQAESAKEASTTFSRNERFNDNGYICIPYPDIAGVMIVCTALETKDDFLAIKNAVSTCLDINQSQIYIIGGTDNNEKIS